jgi:hypothetical protein
LFQELSEILEESETLDLLAWPYLRQNILTGESLSPRRHHRNQTDDTEAGAWSPNSQLASLGSPQWEAEEDLRKDSAELLLETYLAEYEVCAPGTAVVDFVSTLLLLTVARRFTRS